MDLLYNPVVIQYLNRLADLAFIMARYEDRHLPVEALTGQTSLGSLQPLGEARFRGRMELF